MFFKAASRRTHSKAASPQVVRSKTKSNDRMGERACCGLFNPAKAGLEVWGDFFHGLKPVAIHVYPFGIKLEFDLFD